MRKMFARARIHPFWRRIQDRPFAGALAMLLIVSPVITALGQGLTADVLEDLVPTAMFYALLGMYFFAGTGLFLGIGLNRTNIEAAGCVLAVSGLAIRSLALIAVLGFTFPVVATCAFYFVFGGACVERLVQCFKGEHIVRVTKVYELEEDDGD